MILTDGRPTIAWADIQQLDPVTNLLTNVRDRFTSGSYKWVNHAASPDGKPPHKCTACLGMALAYECHLYDDSKKLTHSDLQLAEKFVYEAITPPEEWNVEPRVRLGRIYDWNDRLTTKSGKRSVIRALNRAISARQKNLKEG